MQVLNLYESFYLQVCKYQNMQMLDLYESFYLQVCKYQKMHLCVRVVL